MARVAIVTDSTCDLGADKLRELGVTMVPLKVMFGEHTYLDWLDLQPDEFYKKLAASPVLPTTSQPSPADFLSAYSRLAEEGHDAIVSIHLSAALSGTHHSAMMASDDSPIPVHVVDTKKVSQAVALVVKEACTARDAGMSADEVAKRAEDVSASMRLFFVLDTLEYLVKGGRAGKAQGLAASLLNIKPVLTMNAEGTIEPFKKVKGRRKATAALAEHVAAESKTHGTMRTAILHGCTADCGADMRTELEAAGAMIDLESVGLVGAVIGTYAGPDAVGCAYYPIG